MGEERDDEEELNEMDRFITGNQYADSPLKRMGMGSEEPNENRYEDTCEDRVLLYSLYGLLQIVGIVCIALVCVWTSVYMGGFSWDGSRKTFNWHPVFMTVGLVFFYGNAAVIYRVLRTTEKTMVKLIHGALNATAFIFAVIGLAAVWLNHNHIKYANAYSLHSWVGVGAVMLYACQLLFGFLGFLYPKLNDDLRKIYLGIHVFFGIVVFALVLVACVSGITEKMLFTFQETYPSLPHVAFVANFFGIMILLFGMIVGYIVYNRKWKRVA